MNGELAIEPFVVAVPEDVLDDLRVRLRRARLPRVIDGDGWGAGVDLEYLRELLDYWLHGYDWRAQERELNAVKHLRANADDIPIHFVQERGRGPQPLPLVLTHGFPWTFWDFRKIIGPLTDPAAYGGDPADSFDVVVPSLPGYAFSTPITRGIGPWETADLWAALMSALGYERFGAFGGDWGRYVTLQLGHKYADRVVGVHVLGTAGLKRWGVERPWDLGGPVPPELPDELRERLLERQRRTSAHVTVQVLEPQSLAAALVDSPAGLCAWLVVRRRNWSDCGGDVESRFSKDHLLTTTMLFWLDGAFATAARWYHEAAKRPWQPSHDRTPAVEVPTGLTLFRADELQPRSNEELAHERNVQFRREHERGGHFAPFEEPEAVVDDIRDFFRPLR